MIHISCLFPSCSEDFLSISGYPQVYQSSQVSLSLKCQCSLYPVLPPLCIFHSALLMVIFFTAMPMTPMLPKPLILRCQKDTLLSAGEGKPPPQQIKLNIAWFTLPLILRSTFFNQVFKAPPPPTPLSPTYNGVKQKERLKSLGTAIGSLLKNLVSLPLGIDKYTCMHITTSHLLPDTHYIKARTPHATDLFKS